MVEDGGVAKTGWDPATLPRLRFNVRDLDAAIADLRAKGVDTRREDHPWGSVARFTDPDGNLCQLRSEAGFGG
jgi:lactoylglutathione lyase